jgi:quinone-modifying oxidoreductase subunit QmoA
MASLKQATYIREQYPDAKIYISTSISARRVDRYEKFYNKIKETKMSFSSRARWPRSAKIRTPKTSPWLPKMPYRGKDSPDGGDGRSGHRHAAHGANAKLPADLKVQRRRLHHQRL